jgi:hypothetical protein
MFKRVGDVNSTANFMRGNDMRSRLLIICAATWLLSACGSGERVCETRECFTERLSECAAAEYTTEHAAGARARYTVIGPEPDGCRVRFAFAEHSDASLEGKSMTFTLGPDGPVDDQLQNTVSACLSGEGPEHGCQGALAVSVDPIEGPGGASEDRLLPCGEPVEVEGEPLFPMPRDGQWGFVTRGGDWAIEPRWDQVMDFSEGRAAVAEESEWGVIDRQGQYVLEPTLRSQTYTMAGGTRVGSSPLKPFSEGCAAGVADTASEPPFFVDRDGQFHWRNALPRDLAEHDVREFGSFSEGRAWFRVFDPGLGDPHGWINAKGEIALEPEFMGAGDYVGGLAPAATERESWGFINRDGELELPGKWTLRDARAFSEDRALVDTGTYDWAYFDRDGIAFDTIRFPDSGDEARFGASGDFHDGLAPVMMKGEQYSSLVYADRSGVVAFVPNEIDGLKVCNPDSLPEFRHGLVRLLVADDGETCGSTHTTGLATYDQAHYVYLDTAGDTVLRQQSGD